MARSKYETHILPNWDKIMKWAEAGVTSKDIAKKLGLSYSCFKKYTKTHEDLGAAFAQACIVPDDEVEAALYRRACGYQYEEITLEEKLDRDGGIHTLKKVVRRDIAPDPTSAMFWLTNRRPEIWKYKRAEEQKDDDTGNTGVALLPEILPEEAQKDGQTEGVIT